MQIINCPNVQMNLGDEFFTPVPINDNESGAVTLIMANGSLTHHVINTGQLIHGMSVSSAYMTALLAEKKIVFVGTLSGADGERMEIDWRPELRKLFNPCVVELSTTHKAWPLMAKLAEEV